jgi:hypothetical protein
MKVELIILLKLKSNQINHSITPPIVVCLSVSLLKPEIKGKLTSLNYVYKFQCVV